MVLFGTFGPSERFSKEDLKRLQNRIFLHTSVNFSIENLMEEIMLPKKVFEKGDKSNLLALLESWDFSILQATTKTEDSLKESPCEG